MKKRTIILVATAVLVALTAIFVESAPTTPDPSIISSPVSEIACAIKNALVHIVGALAAVIFAAAGLRWVASRDDPGKRKQARDTMVHALIGLVIVAIADALVGAMGSFRTCA
jgi:hypothetical protein